MIPKFTSKTDLIGFIRALPHNANYIKLLKDDFGVEAPADAPAFECEYLYKYSLEGLVVQNIPKGPELTRYSAEKVLKFGKHFPWVKEPTSDPIDEDGNLLPKEPKAVRTTVPKVKRAAAEKFADGSVIYLAHRDVWVFYFNGKIQLTKKTEAQARASGEAKFGV